MKYFCRMDPMEQSTARSLQRFI